MRIRKPRQCATRKDACFVIVNILIFISVNVFFFSPLEDNYHLLKLQMATFNR